MQWRNRESRGSSNPRTSREIWRGCLLVATWGLVLPRLLLTVERTGSSELHWQVRALWDAGALLGLY